MEKYLSATEAKKFGRGRGLGHGLAYGVWVPLYEFYNVSYQVSVVGRAFVIRASWRMWLGMVEEDRSAGVALFEVDVRTS